MERFTALTLKLLSASATTEKNMDGNTHFRGSLMRKTKKELIQKIDCLENELQQVRNDKRKIQHEFEMQTVSMQKIATDFDTEIAKYETTRKELLNNLSNQDASSSNLMHQMDQCLIRKTQLAGERDGLLVQLEELKQQNTIAQNKALELTSSMETIARDYFLKLSESEARNNTLRLQLNHANAENAIKISNIQLSKQTQACEFINQIRRMQLENQQLKTQLKKKEEGMSCPICFCPCQESGNHRLVTLPCGHLFGDGCVRAHLTRNSTCPLCRSSASLKNLIYLFGFNASPSGNQ